MKFDPKLFYQRYQKDYHSIKAIYLDAMLANLSATEKFIHNAELPASESEDFRRVLKSDLRQTYFHAIETLFELLFALRPDGDKVNDLALQSKLTTSNWRKSYNEIKAISEDIENLNFLDETVIANKYKPTVAEYIFYMGLFTVKDYDSHRAKVAESIGAIKTGLCAMAKDFVDREEYNAYKHGLRLIPVAQRIALADNDTLEIKLDLDLTDSMSYFVKTKDERNSEVVTKVFDSKRDYNMTMLCSSLIHQMIFYRRISLPLPSDRDKFPQIEYFFYNQIETEALTQGNVQIDQLIFKDTWVPTSRHETNL